MLTIVDRTVDLVKIFSDDEMINGESLREHRKVLRMFDIF